MIFLDILNSLLFLMQFGIGKQHSTEIAVCYFIEQVRSKLDKGGIVGSVFRDLQKAFDTLNHNILLSKLLHFNFSIDIMKWIESYMNVYLH